MRNTSIKQLIIGIFCVGFFAVAGPDRAEACGTLDMHLKWYWEAGDEKPQTLLQIADLCGEFRANHTEEPLLAVFSDAVGEGIDRAIIQASFEAFWCLAGIAGSEGYDAILAAIPDANCPTRADVANWYVVAVDYANIRAGAKLDAVRTGVAARDSLMWKTDDQGDWFKVRGMGREQDGYIHSSLLVPYRPIENAGDAQ